MKYLQFNRETRINRSESRSAHAFTSRLAHQEAADAPPTKLTPARETDDRGAALRTPGNAENCWFGHTTSSNTASYSKLQEVRSLVRQPQVPRWETTREPVVPNVFFFSRHLLFSQSPGRGSRARLQFPAAESRRPASWARIGRTKSNTAVAESAWE
ncbi:Hypothetical_protein [Hexamita inflata]|uniref:Hypothetical_protein n=1 Tax=Hexamita inflata TaxID=28002 RepID=A0AA86RPJ2_9EUKA|nr:Hypothetical protein HINF_LOCUS65951 [Hexamita inflata]